MKVKGNFPSTRLRRVRSSNWVRRLVTEHSLSANDLILPIFLTEGKNKREKIKNMPDIFRYSIDNLNQILDQASKYRIPMIALFPNTPNSKKDKFGSEALNDKNIVCKALKKIKKNYKNFGLMCDVALDPYTDHGHDGLLIDGIIDNDKTLEILINQAVLQAEMGCDVIAPSDMMDGRIGRIRKELDKNNFKDTKILSYAVKYASNFYGPFRNAIGSNKFLKGDKKTYQMNFHNSEEAIREVAFDVKEGADFVMVKPGLPYLDIISLIKNNFKIPVFSYQVSGEYSLIKNAIKNKIIDKSAIFETLISLKRAGSSAIVTYFALQICKELKNQLK
jgi:porphobilinogen synthase|tara:strand:- start:3669 stop:4670 length:1002 start_codon:yes stop_codon:yes gene_type:complete